MIGNKRSTGLSLTSESTPMELAPFSPVVHVYNVQRKKMNMLRLMRRVILAYTWKAMQSAVHTLQYRPVYKQQIRHCHYPCHTIYVTYVIQLFEDLALQCWWHQESVWPAMWSLWTTISVLAIWIDCGVRSLLDGLVAYLRRWHPSSQQTNSNFHKNYWGIVPVSFKDKQTQLSTSFMLQTNKKIKIHVHSLRLLATVLWLLRNSWRAACTCDLLSAVNSSAKITTMILAYH